MSKKYIIDDNPVSFVSISDIFYREVNGEEDYNTFDSFEEAKQSLLYALKETFGELDEKLDIQKCIDDYHQLVNMNESDYRLTYSKNFA